MHCSITARIKRMWCTEFFPWFFQKALSNSLIFPWFLPFFQFHGFFQVQAFIILQVLQVFPWWWEPWMVHLFFKFCAKIWLLDGRSNTSMIFALMVAHNMMSADGASFGEPVMCIWFYIKRDLHLKMQSSNLYFGKPLENENAWALTHLPWPVL